MNAINYFKLDHRLVRSALNLSYGFFLLIVVAFLFTRPTFGINYFFFFMIIFVTLPFQLTKTDGCDMLYAILPANRSEQVLGRMLFLGSLFAGTVLIVALTSTLMYFSGRIGSLEIVNILLIGTFTGLIPLIQYPLYYRYGVGKARMLSMLVYMVPAMVILSLSSIYEMVGGNENAVMSLFTFVMEHPTIYIVIVGFLIGAASVISYRMSVKILITRSLDPEIEDGKNKSHRNKSFFNKKTGQI
jgi:hypothetical protein